MTVYDLIHRLHDIRSDAQVSVTSSGLEVDGLPIRLQQELVIDLTPIEHKRTKRGSSAS